MKQIKGGWVAALFSAGVTLVVTLFALFGTAIVDFSMYELYDVALICALAYGIYRKSRVCAVALLIYFITAKVYIMAQAGISPGLVLGAIFTYYFWRAAAGTFAYQKVLRQTTATPSHG